MNSSEENLISNILDLPQKIRQDVNNTINAELHLIQQIIKKFLSPKVFKESTLYGFGSLATHEMVVTKSGKIQSDFDMILILNDEDFYSSSDIITELVKSLTENSKKISLDFIVHPKSKFQKILLRGHIGSYRKKRLFGKEILVPTQTPPSPTGQVWNNILMLTPPVEELENLIFRSNLKILKRYIEYLRHQDWPSNTSLTYLMELGPLSDSDKKQVYYFLTLEAEDQIKYEDAYSVFIFTRQLLRKDIETVWVNRNHDYLYSLKEDYLYTFYYQLIFTEYDELDTAELKKLISNKVNPYSTKELQNIILDSDTKEVMVNKTTANLWQMTKELKTKSIATFQSLKLDLQVDLNILISTEECQVPLDAFFKKFEDSIVGLLVDCKEKDANLHQLITFARKLIIPITIRNSSIDPKDVNYQFMKVEN